MDYKSKFLCECGSLLYFDAKTKEEFCLNKQCSNCVNEQVKNTTTPVDDYFRKKLSSFKIEIRKYSRDAILTYLNIRRESLIQDYFSMKGMDIQNFYAVNELLRMINNIQFRGRIVSNNKFENLFKRFSKLHDEKNFLDEVLNKKYVITNNRTLILKYATVFTKLFANYGIIAKEKISDKTTFKYDKIDFKHDFGKEYKQGDDLLIYYKRFYRLMITIDYFLNYHYKQSGTYKYNFSNRDIAFLLSFWHSMNSNLSEPPFQNMKKHLTINCSDTKTHEKFLNNLILCKYQVPIFIKKSNTYFMGKLTILFFTFYLMGLYSKEITQEGKEIASTIFEKSIRERLRKKDYFVPFNEEFSLSKKSYSYDIIAISKSKKEILLIEAKYKDLPSSSLNGITLINQELYAKNGLINMADKQQKRLEFFKENLNNFKKQLGIENINDYYIRAFIISKYQPLIYEKQDIEIMEIDELIESI